MNDPVPLYDPNLQLFVQDFDALADRALSAIDGDRRPARHEKVFCGEREFTTEWQVDLSVLMAQAL